MDTLIIANIYKNLKKKKNQTKPHMSLCAHKCTNMLMIMKLLTFNPVISKLH